MEDFSVKWPGEKDEHIDTDLVAPQEQPVSDSSEDVVLPVDATDVPEFSITKSLVVAAQNRCGRLIS